MSKSPFSIICVGKEPGHFYTTVFPIFEFNTSFTGELLFYSETEILQDSIDGFCILFHDIQNIDELFLHKLRNKHNFLFSPVIAISRNASIQESVLAIKAGYQDYLDWKAITSSEIFRLVHHYSPEKQAYKKNHEFYIKTRELVGELVSDYTFGIVYNHKTESFLFEWEFGKKIIGSVIFQETIRTFGKKIFLKNLKLKESDILSLLKTEHGSKIETVIDFVENGEKHWLSILLIHFKEKEEQFFIGIARDVTEKILSEEKLHRQSELIAAIFDNSPLYMSMYDGKGYLLRVNKAKSKFLKKYNIAKKP
ncbi:MAG: hypothetical protein KDK45_11890, partial [Leptospiraceae bacterium]|nr:hypothetical protein [Leptospiraceae bacterium]